MATAAWRFEVEKTVEQRLERIEVHVEHIQADVSEIKATLSETDKRLTGKLDAIAETLNDLKVGRAYDKVWFLLMTAGLLWVIAKAFKWI